MALCLLHSMHICWKKGWSMDPMFSTRSNVKECVFNNHNFWRGYLVNRDQIPWFHEIVLQSRRVSSKNALIVMTSNVGPKLITKGRRKSIGLSFTDEESTSTSYAGFKALVMEELQLYFLPELPNRWSSCVLYDFFQCCCWNDLIYPSK